MAPLSAAVQQQPKKGIGIGNGIGSGIGIGGADWSGLGALYNDGEEKRGKKFIYLFIFLSFLLLLMNIN